MPSGPDLVSVVIPVWGAYDGPRLDEALRSLRAQDVPVEIVLVDNASDPPVTRADVEIVRSEERIALGAARNLGLDAVRTPFVVFWDADDVMPPGTLTRLLERLERDPGLVACSATILDSLTEERHHWPRLWPLRISRRQRLFAVLNAVSSLYGVIGALVRTDAARDARFPDSDGGDDWVLAVSLAFRGRIAVDHRPGRRYQRHGGSVSAPWGAAEAHAHAAVASAPACAGSSARPGTSITRHATFLPQPRSSSRRVPLARQCLTGSDDAPFGPFRASDQGSGRR